MIVVYRITPTVKMFTTLSKGLRGVLSFITSTPTLINEDKAPTSSIRTELDHLLECGLCLEAFTTPLALPCLHTFCQKCLDTYIQASAGKNTFKCPMCRRETPVTDLGAAAFPPNLTVLNLRDAVAKTSAIRERNCDVCMNHKAEHLCTECNELLCDRCLVAVHNRYNKSHVTHGIDKLADMSAAQIVQLVAEHCREHPDERLRFFCSTCNDVICRDCRLNNHVSPDHKCKDLSELNNEWREAVICCDREIAESEQTLINEKASLVQQKEQVSLRAESSLLRLHTARNRLLAAISSKFEDLESMIRNQASRDRTTLLNQIHNVSEIIENVQNSRKDIEKYLPYMKNSHLFHHLEISKTRVEQNKQLVSSVCSQPQSLQSPVYVPAKVNEDVIQNLVGEVKSQHTPTPAPHSEVWHYVDIPKIIQYDVLDGPVNVAVTPSGGYVISHALSMRSCTALSRRRAATVTARLAFVLSVLTSAMLAMVQSSIHGSTVAV